MPDFNSYLAFVLSRATVRNPQPCPPLSLTPPLQQDQPLEVRQSAGLLLKNNVRRDWKTLNPAVQAYVKARRRRFSPPARTQLTPSFPHQESLLPCMGISERYVRITVGTAIRCASPLLPSAALAAQP